MKNRFHNKRAFQTATFFLLVLSLASFTQEKARAAMWPAIDPIIKTSLERVERQINGVIMGAAKQAALAALDQELSFLITGSSGGARFVVNWRDYLVQQPANQTAVQLNAFIDRSLNGRGSLSSYIPKGSEGFSLNINYQNQLARNAKQLLNKPTCQNNYIGNPSQMFVSGNFKNLSLYLNGNDPWTYNTCVSNEMQRLLEENKLIAQTKVTSPGILGTEVDGMTVTPAGVIEAQVNKVKTMGLDIITNAEHLPEILTAVVTQTINQSIQQGIGNIQAQVHREVSNVKSQAQAQINSAVGLRGPGALYQR